MTRADEILTRASEVMKSAYDELAEFVGDDFEATNAVRLALAEGTHSALAPEGVQKQAARDFLISIDACRVKREIAERHAGGY